MPLNVRVGGGELPMPACSAALLSLAAFVALLVYHGGSRWIGIGWMVFGVALYVYYRTSEGKPVFKRVTVPERTLTRPRQEAEYGSILVPDPRARRSTTTSSRPPGAWPRRRTTTWARAAR